MKEQSVIKNWTLLGTGGTDWKFPGTVGG